MKHPIRFVVTIMAVMAMVAAFALAGCSSSTPSATTTSKSSTASASTSAKSSAVSTSAKSSASTQAATADAVTLQIFAANSLEKAMPEVQALYTSKNPNVTFADSQFKASGDLVTTLQGGGTADILITASKGSMDDAEGDTPVIDSATRRDMFGNDLVIATKADSTISITSIADLGTNADIKSIAIGEPNTVPAGKYALQALESVNLATEEDATDGTITPTWDASIADKMNAGADKVGTVAKYISDGTADCGFVYSSDIYRYDGIQIAYTCPADSHKDIVYPGAVCTSSANAEAAAAFLDFCTTDPDAIAIFQQYGFEVK